MKHVFWLVPNVLAGRCGPNEHWWRLEELRKAGIGAVLSVNDGELCLADDFSLQKLAYACFPLSNNAPPRAGDLEHCLRVLPEAFSFAERNIAQNLPVVVHCAAGKDRTGLFLAYYLVRRERCSVEHAMARVRAVRPIAFTAEGWHDFAVQVLSAARAKL